MITRAATWWTILRICLEERLVYRGDFALGTLMRFLPIVTQVFLWTAVFAAVSREEIAGYSRNDIIAFNVVKTAQNLAKSLHTYTLSWFNHLKHNNTCSTYFFTSVYLFFITPK